MRTRQPRRWRLGVTPARAAAVALLLAAATTGPVVATLRAQAQDPGDGPHGGYSSTTDSCRSCHAAHYAEGGRLLSAATERQVCYRCHTAVRDAFGEATIGQTTQATVHPVPRADPGSGAELTCGDCHTPHRSPDEAVGLLRRWDGSGYVYSPPEAPIGDAFCTSCHASLPTISEAYGGHAGYEAIPHQQDVDGPAASGIDCIVCHDPHGSSEPALLVSPEGDLCVLCHDPVPGP